MQKGSHAQQSRKRNELSLWIHLNPRGYQCVLAARLCYCMASWSLSASPCCTLVNAHSVGPGAKQHWYCHLPCYCSGFGYSCFTGTSSPDLKSCFQTQVLALGPFFKQTSSPLFMAKPHKVVLAYSYYRSLLLYHLYIKWKRTLKLPKWIWRFEFW